MRLAMKNSLGRHRSDAGFTLIELLVVLVLMGIIGALAQPAMAGYVNRTKTRRALDRVTADIALTRTLAIRSGSRAVLELYGPDSYRVWVESTPADTVRRVSLGADYVGVQLQAPTADGRLVFNSRGVLLSQVTGGLTARLGAVADTLKITTAGRVYRAY